MIIGIDPGSNGGLVALSDEFILSEAIVEAVKMPETAEGILQWLQGYVMARTTVFIEAIPRWTGAQRFAKQTVYGASIASLYGNMKLCQGLAMGLGGSIVLLTPQKWQHVVECVNSERLEKTPWKNKLKARAQELFPREKMTLWKADALLIAAAGLKLISDGKAL